MLLRNGGPKQVRFDTIRSRTIRSRTIRSRTIRSWTIRSRTVRSRTVHSWTVHSWTVRSRTVHSWAVCGPSVPRAVHSWGRPFVDRPAPADREPVEALRARLRAPGVKVTLRLLRGGKTVDVELTTRRLI